jgi:TPR repeat protein
MAAATGQPQLMLDYAQFKVRNGASYSDKAVAELLNGAAAKGDPSAQLFLADKTLASGGSADSIANAVRTITNLADNDNQLAMVRLGDYAISPQAGKPDNLTAEKWFQSATKKGNLEAQAKLGSLYVTAYTDQPEKPAPGVPTLLLLWRR